MVWVRQQSRLSPPIDHWFVQATHHKPLRKIAEAFKDLADLVNSDIKLQVAPFSHACDLILPLFGCLGLAFRFAEMDYVAKVCDLGEATKSFGTLPVMTDKDLQANSVKKQGSHTRNLLRVKCGLEMVRVLFEKIIVTEYDLQTSPFSLLL